MSIRMARQDGGTGAMGPRFPGGNTGNAARALRQETDMKSNSNDPSTTSATQLMLNPQPPPNFLDSALESRRIFSEVWGTFLLVLVAAGGGVVRNLSGGN